MSFSESEFEGINNSVTPNGGADSTPVNPIGFAIRNFHVRLSKLRCKKIET